MAKSRQDYEDMSRDELVAIIGSDIDEDTPHAQLVSMAMERESDTM